MKFAICIPRYRHQAKTKYHNANVGALSVADVCGKEEYVFGLHYHIVLFQTSLHVRMSI